MFGKSNPTPRVEAAISRSVNYEVSLADLALRSQKRAWFVAGSAMLMSLLLACGYLLMLPLKERLPFIVMADAYTGTATVAPLVADLSRSPLTANEAINKANIANYIVARESYDYDILTTRDWSLVWLMSTKEVGSAYDQALSPSSPASPIKQYGKARAIRINIISLTPNQEGWFDKQGSATVRFQRVLVDKANGSPTVLDTRVATIIYTYNEDLPLTDQQRISNPLGFQVVDYRVVSEMGSLPVQPPDAAPAAMPAAAGATGPGGEDVAPAEVVVPPPPGSVPATSSTPTSPAPSSGSARNANGVNDR
jgi:type IV secretion system protein VirB8